MQNPLWKLTALAAVVGIGFLAVVQAQRGLTRPGDDQIAEVLKDAALTEEGDSDTSAASGAKAAAPKSVAAADREFEPVRRARASIPFDDAAAPAGNDEPEPWDGSPAPDPRSRASEPATAVSPRARGLDFRDPTPDPSETASTPADNDPAGSDPFAQPEPSPAATNPRRGTVTLAGNEEPADDPFAGPAPRPRAGAPRLLAPDDAAEMTAPGNREPEIDSAAGDAPSAGPRLVVPAGGGDEGFFDSDPPPRSVPKPRAAPDPRREEPAAEPAFDFPPASRDADDPTLERSRRGDEDRAAPAPRNGRRAVEPEDRGPPDSGAFPDLPLDGRFPGSEPAAKTEPDDKPLPRSGVEPSRTESRPLPTPESSRGARDLPADFPDEPALRDRPPALLPVDPDETPMPRGRPAREPRARESRPVDDDPRNVDREPSRRDNPYLRRDDSDPVRPGSRANPLVPAGADPADDVLGDGTVDPETPKGPQRPQLKIEKQAPQNATLGQPMVYNILIKNVGESAAHDVVVEDRVPRGTQLSGTNPQAELVDKTLVWKLGTMQPGEERKIGVRVVPVSEGQIGSIATVNFVAEVGAKTLITAPKLQLDLATPKQVRQGEPVPVMFQIRNTGNADAKGVIIRNLVPEGLRHPDGNDLEYDLGTLPAGATREVKLTLSAVKAGESLNRAIATADGGVSAEASSQLEVVGPSLAVSRSGPKKTWLGRTAQYTTTITNESDTMVPTATVSETIPAGMDVLEAPNAHISADRRTLSWRIDRLGPHQSAELKVKLLPKTTGVKSSTVKVSEGPGQPHEVTTETEVAGVAQLDADVSGADGPLGVGDKVTFQVVVRNRGNDAAANVRLTLGLPAEVEYVSSDSRVVPSRDGRELVLPAIARLEPGREAVYQVVVKASRDGDARLTLTTDADDLRAPLVKEEQLVILADETPATVTTPRRR